MKSIFLIHLLSAVNILQSYYNVDILWIISLSPECIASVQVYDCTISVMCRWHFIFFRGVGTAGCQGVMPPLSKVGRQNYVLLWQKNSDTSEILEWKQRMYSKPGDLRSQMHAALKPHCLSFCLSVLEACPSTFRSCPVVFSYVELVIY